MRLISRVASVLVVSGTAACAAGTADPTRPAEQALEQAALEGVEIDWDDETRIAHLVGTVDSPADRRRAEDVAEGVIGTSGQVLNELTIRGLNEHAADDLDGRIRSHLEEVLDDDPHLADRDIEVQVRNGVVTVKGEVHSAAEKSRVSDLVRAASGVKDMANALEVLAER
jgi:hyperosmotically inducible periplasmic protein